MITAPNKKRLTLFLALAFGIAWAACLVISVTGGLQESPMIVPEINLSLAGFLLATVMMGAPAFANLLTRIVTREGLADLWLKPFRFGKPARYWLLAWLLPAVGSLVGALVFFLVFPGYLDRNLTALAELLAERGAGSLSPWTYVLISIAQAVVLAPVLNAVSCFGEEFGWRAYLLPKLLPMGAKKAVLVSGLIWGVWHAPVIALGHNYGTAYPGYPWLGILAMVWFTVIIGILFSWLTLKEGSVWPAVIGHAALNGIAAIGLVAVQGRPNPLLGPAPTGLVGGLFFTALAIALWLAPRAFELGKERWKSEPIRPANPQENVQE